VSGFKRVIERSGKYEIKGFRHDIWWSGLRSGMPVSPPLPK